MSGILQRLTLALSLLTSTGAVCGGCGIGETLFCHRDLALSPVLASLLPCLASRLGRCPQTCLQSPAVYTVLLLYTGNSEIAFTTQHYQSSSLVFLVDTQDLVAVSIHTYEHCEQHRSVAMSSRLDVLDKSRFFKSKTHVISEALFYLHLSLYANFCRGRSLEFLFTRDPFDKNPSTL